MARFGPQLNLDHIAIRHELRIDGEAITTSLEKGSVDYFLQTSLEWTEQQRNNRLTPFP